jgi:hypothetical protein
VTIREAIKVPWHLLLRGLFIGGGYAMIVAGDLDQAIKRLRRKRGQAS